jgi:fructan beta-fructosidase
MRWILFLIAIALASACRAPESGVDQTAQQYNEPFRPRFHFSPHHNWTNDPNGLVYFAGEYHLYYQYNPFGNRWGHMSWGHAVTKDLLHWQHLPVAIPEYVDDNGDSTMIFSGSAVVDDKNTSGFFPSESGGMVAIYTSHVHKAKQGLRQHQSIAYSKDSGRTYTRYDGNPVLDIGRKDFRDPKVFWHEPTQKWIMATVIPDEFKVNLYASKDLKSWSFLSEFGPLGDTARIWECPDLFPLNASDDPSMSKWVMIVSNSHPQGATYVGMQYFIGSFDGTSFVADRPSQYPLYLDFGRDYYAAITYDNVPASDGRTLLLGWANNWAYGEDIPTYPWKSAMALPREVSLRTIDGQLRLVQQPITEYKTLRGDEITDLAGNTSRSIEIEYSLVPGKATAGLRVLKTDSAHTIIGYDAERGEVYIDRTESGNVSFHPTFTGVDRAPVRLVDGKLSLTILIDQSLIEVFVNGGEQVLTTQVFPTGSGSGVELFSNDESVVEVRAWEFNSIW